jgi:phosphate transport system substrate-binding protein
MVQGTERLKQGLQGCLQGLKIDALASDSEEGVKALLNGEADIAAISRPPTVPELNAKLQAEKVGEDPVAIVVKKENPFQGELSHEQLKGIFKGAIDNWSQVGGPSVPLRFINASPDSGTHQVMRELVLNRDNFGTTPNIETLTPGLGLPLRISKLGADGITYYSYRNIKDQKTVRLIQVDGKLPGDLNYRYRRPLYYLYKDPQSPGVKAFLTYAKSDQGQQIIQLSKRD